MDIENVPMPVKQTKPERVAKPRAKHKIKVSEALRNAAKDYKAAYKVCYGMLPTITYDGVWVRIAGHAQGFNLKRLKELTAQLNNRRG